MCDNAGLLLLLRWYFQVWWIVPRRYSGLFERTMMVKWGLDLHTTVARLRTFATFPVLTNTEMSACGVSRIIQHPGQMVITKPVCRCVSNPCVVNKAYGLRYLLNLIYMVLNNTFKECVFHDYCAAEGFTYQWTLSTGLSLAESSTFLPEWSSSVPGISADEILSRHILQVRWELETELPQIMQDQDRNAPHMILLQQRKDIGLRMLRCLERI